MSNVVKAVEVKQEKARNGKDDIVTLQYEHLSGKFKGQVWTIKGLLKALPPESRAALKEAKTGDTITITTAPYQYTDANGNAKTGYNLSSVEAGAAVKTNTTNTSTTTTNNTNSTWKPKDETGVKVGAARNQAIAYLSRPQNKKDYTLDDVDRVAYEIISRQAKQEQAVRDGKNTDPTENQPQDQYEEESDDFFGGN